MVSVINANGFTFTAAQKTSAGVDMQYAEVRSSQQEVFENYRETNSRSFAAVRFKLKSMVAMTWQPAQEGLAQILQLLKVSSFDK